MDDLALYRRLARQAAASWHLVAVLFLVSLLASPLALLAPLPLKIAVDSVLGSRPLPGLLEDRKSTRLNSSHGSISYAVFCLIKQSGFYPASDSHSRAYGAYGAVGIGVGSTT